MAKPKQIVVDISRSGYEAKAIIEKNKSIRLVGRKANGREALPIDPKASTAEALFVTAQDDPGAYLALADHLDEIGHENAGFLRQKLQNAAASIKPSDYFIDPIRRNIQRYEQHWIDFDVTFAMGDSAEYDSYNLSYFGPIVGIGEKTVTIKEPYQTSARRHRLNHDSFLWRNWDFDAAKAFARNSETMMYI